MTFELDAEELGHPEFVRLAQSFYKDSGFPGTFSQAHFIASWQKFYELNMGRIWVSAEVDLKTIHGAIGVLIHPDIYDGELVAQELFWYVESQAGFKAALELFYNLEHWVKTKGAKRLNMACVCNKHMVSLRRFYEKRGFRPIDLSYYKDLT